jgi:septal ring factor EnvC (AmiA/AmiB activator)
MKIESPTRTLLALAAVALLAAPALAQEDDVRKELEELRKGQQELQRQIELEKEIEALKQGQQAIQKELAEIKRLIQTRPAAAAPARRGPDVAGKTFDLRANLVKGEQTAKLTLVEFTDYQ